MRSGCRKSSRVGPRLRLDLWRVGGGGIGLSVEELRVSVDCDSGRGRDIREGGRRAGGGVGSFSPRGIAVLLKDIEAR